MSTFPRSWGDMMTPHAIHGILYIEPWYVHRILGMDWSFFIPRTINLIFPTDLNCIGCCFNLVSLTFHLSSPYLRSVYLFSFSCSEDGRHIFSPPLISWRTLTHISDWFLRVDKTTGCSTWYTWIALRRKLQRPSHIPDSACSPLYIHCILYRGVKPLGFLSKQTLSAAAVKKLTSTI